VVRQSVRQVMKQSSTFDEGPSNIIHQREGYVPSNVEIKARVRDFEKFLTVADSLKTRPARDLMQHDIFFLVSHGRLKLRLTTGMPAELIHYTREDAVVPRQSQYTIFPVEDPELLRTILRNALGVLGEVKKRRRLFLVHKTRIHLDEVESLGYFAEIEVVLDRNDSVDDGKKIAENLMQVLGIEKRDLVESAYIDLLRSGVSAPMATLP
jgi:predicted adenylyl cyclase CyaB